MMFAGAAVSCLPGRACVDPVTFLTKVFAGEALLPAVPTFPPLTAEGFAGGTWTTLFKLVMVVLLLALAPAAVGLLLVVFFSSALTPVRMLRLPTIPAP
eukprot:CAMPEP_0119113742 /NCGR_PEP_ID=MMETSP1180-20130426/45051_1 /TAXON_ID=3052 ORGANISM="Chlamydomonas cf sp, Strain CCMP681" /NCGR_SAMPLE_ID=MMETSP1180 /ASSEMBLY_ACC=CAM_ASM_000741 /LENGTH=98 /DNA_ID=CAMNT_0007101973 /DNA_START=339 /DNA_END=635 /DNA_ORIENTATION=+